ncbi:MAG: hypothetical protein MZU95_09555 [Desulfomicrobium escambiense]|nr:hypothetical protein [Desulfomicrobium escambiense]
MLAVEMPDHPGGMNAVLKPLRDAKINAITMYPYIGRANNPIMIMEVDNTQGCHRRAQAQLGQALGQGPVPALDRDIDRPECIHPLWRSRPSFSPTSRRCLPASSLMAMTGPPLQ